MAFIFEPEIGKARRGFPDAQALLAGVVLRRLPQRVAVGWHDTAVDPEMGSFAVVRAGAGLDDLIGEILRVSNGDHAVFVYVLGARSVPYDISLARRAFLGVSLLSAESRRCIVEVTG